MTNILEALAMTTVGTFFSFVIIGWADNASTYLLRGERLSDKIDEWTGGLA